MHNFVINTFSSIDHTTVLESVHPSINFTVTSCYLQQTFMPTNALCMPTVLASSPCYNMPPSTFSSIPSTGPSSKLLSMCGKCGSSLSFYPIYRSALRCNPETSNRPPDPKAQICSTRPPPALPLLLSDLFISNPRNTIRSNQIWNSMMEIEARRMSAR